MSSGMIFFIAVVCMAVLMLVVGYIGNKVVDKTTDAVRNKAVRRKNAQQSNQTENLADRFEQGRKL